MVSRNECTYVSHCVHIGVSKFSVCIKMLTYCLGCIIGLSMTTPAKRKALLASGTLNPHPEAVRSELFNTDFFDP